MRVIPYKLQMKFGESGVATLLGRGAKDIDRLDALEGELAGEGGPVLVVIHGYPADSDETERIRSLMDDNDQLYVLFVSDGGVAPDLATRMVGARAFGFGAAVRNLGEWEAHPQSVRTRLEEFVRESVQATTQAPPWNLLREPAGPQYVLACLLAALAGRPEVVPEEWRKSFEKEVDDLRGKGVRRELSWGSRDSAEELRAFLEEAGAIEEYRG